MTAALANQLSEFPADFDFFSFYNNRPRELEEDEPIDIEVYRRKKEELKRLEKVYLRKRAKLWAQCNDANDPKAAAELRASVLQQCKDDPLFFFDYFAWCYDPRAKPGQHVSPLVLYAYQRKLVMWLHGLLTRVTESEGLEIINAIVEKSRDMGASWVVFTYFLWCWRFHNGSFLIVSRKEEEVDSRGDMSTSFEKLRFTLRLIESGFPLKWAWPESNIHGEVQASFPWMMPEGFVWKKHDHMMMLKNPEGGEITGESANSNAGRGGRCTGVVFDEMGHIDDDTAAWNSAGGTTNFRLGLGTPNGPNNKYANLAQGECEEAVHKATLHWRLHPLKSAGMEIINGKPTSPWYEFQKRNKGEEEIARELDISYAKSTKGLVFANYTVMHQVRGLQPVSGKPVIRAWDPGVAFGVGFFQVDNYQRVLCLDEIHVHNAHIRDVAMAVQEKSEELKRRFPWIRFVDTGDPNGATRQASSAEVPEFDTLRDEFGIFVDYEHFREIPPARRIDVRLNAIDNRLSTINAQTATMSLLVDVEKCPVLHKALTDKYRRKVIRKTGEVLKEIDCPHPYSEAVDNLGYAVVYKLGQLGSKKPRGRSADDMVEKDTYKHNDGLRKRQRNVY